METNNISNKQMQDDLIDLAKVVLWLCHRVRWYIGSKVLLRHLHIKEWEEKAENIIERYKPQVENKL